MCRDSSLRDVLLLGREHERRALLAELVRKGDDESISAVGSALLDSEWPACDELADGLADIGPAAKGALLAGLGARRHHIRSASVKALAQLGGDDVRAEIAKLEQDLSFEVRQDVAEALRSLDGQ